MVTLAAQAAIAQRSHANSEDVERALEEGWKQGVAHAMADGILSREEEERLRDFRDHLTGGGWFSYNLAVNPAQIQAPDLRLVLQRRLA